MRERFGVTGALKPVQNCICDSLEEFVEVESAGRMSRYLVSLRADLSYLRSILSVHQFSRPSDGSGIAEPSPGQRGWGSKLAQDLKCRLVFLVVLPNSLKAFFKKQPAQFRRTFPPLCWVLAGRRCAAGVAHPASQGRSSCDCTDLSFCSCQSELGPL